MSTGPRLALDFHTGLLFPAYQDCTSPHLYSFFSWHVPNVLQITRVGTKRCSRYWTITSLANDFSPRLFSANAKIDRKLNLTGGLESLHKPLRLSFASSSNPIRRCQRSPCAPTPLQSAFYLAFLNRHHWFNNFHLGTETSASK